MLPGHSLQCLQRLLNWGVHIAASLHKYDHVSVYQARLHWLPVIQCCSLYAIYKQYSSPQGILLDPLIEFGTGNGYCTRHENQCAKLDHCRLTKPRDVAGKLWVRLLEALAISSIFSATVYEYFKNSI